MARHGRSAWVAAARLRGLVVVTLVVLAGACTSSELAVSAPSEPPALFGVAVTGGGADGGGADEGPAPTGEVTVAYPEEPVGFLDLHRDDPTATDLQALWGLPLFRSDPAGQLVPGLVAGWELADAPGAFAVDLRLREGTWSDGVPVVAGDVVATFAVLREGPRAAELAPLTEVAALDDRTVRLSFDRPYARWPYLLDGVGVLPAAVLADGGVAGYDRAVPVTGGWYGLERYEPGLEAVFRAHADGPLGAPSLATVRVLVVPSYETALGLLRDGEVDALMGYLALNPVERAGRVPGITASAPIGGTWVGLTWHPDGALGDADEAARRRAIGAAIDVSQLVEGLLGEAGEVATSPVPGVAGSGRAPGGGDTAVGAPVVVVAGGHEAVGFTGRSLQRDLRVAGGELQLVPEPAPRWVVEARTQRDGALRVVRSGPRPTLTSWIADPAVAVAADASVPGTAAFDAGLEAAGRDALVWPLYRVGVVHVWRDDLGGVTPSAWPGLAFAGVDRWTWEST